jgi:hypothetical protein
VAKPVVCAPPPLEQINQKINPAEDKTPEFTINMYEFLFNGSLMWEIIASIRFIDWVANNISSLKWN